MSDNLTDPNINRNEHDDTGGVLAKRVKGYVWNASSLAWEKEVQASGGGTQYADGAARGTGTGTLAMVDDGTNIQSLSGDATGKLNVNNISGTVTLPTDAATQTTLALVKAKTDNIPAQGQALAAASTPVVLTAAQVSTLTPLSSVTVTTGTTAFIFLAAGILNTTSGLEGVMSLAVSGASTITAATVGDRVEAQGVGVNNFLSNYAGGFVITGLTAGANTFTVKYRTNSAGTSFFRNRIITVTGIV